MIYSFVVSYSTVIQYSNKQQLIFESKNFSPFNQGPLVSVSKYKHKQNYVPDNQLPNSSSMFLFHVPNFQWKLWLASLPKKSPMSSSRENNCKHVMTNKVGQGFMQENYISTNLSYRKDVDVLLPSI